MPMPEEVLHYLSQPNSEFHDRIRQYAVNRMRASQQFMAQRYDKWRESEKLYRSFKDADEVDKETQSASMTEGVRKIVVPVTYATIQSILAWQMDFFMQRKPMIPVEGLGSKDVQPAILHELLLEYQLGKMETHGTLVLLQQLLDAHIYGVGILMNGWMVREWLELVRTITPLGFEGQMIGRDDMLTEQDVVAYEGNNATNIVPYDWFPDPRVPIGRFQTGEFCGHMTRRSHTELMTKQAEGVYAGCQFIAEGRSGRSARGAIDGGIWGESNLGPTMGVDPDQQLWIDDQGKQFKSLHHLYALVPPETLQLQSVPVSVHGLPRMWVITIANLDRVIRVEPANLPGRKFPYAAIEDNFNLHSPVNPGLVEIMSGSQYHLSWLINSRMANVRRSMNFELIYDPSLIEQTDLENPNPSGLVRLKQEAFHSGASLDQIVKAFPTADVTSNHLTDARAWMDVIEQVTGANRMVQGISNTGRRAATEVQASLELASGRMKLMLLIACCQGIGDWAEQMIANTQAFLQDRIEMKIGDPYAAVLNQDYMDITPDMLQGRFRIPFLEQGIPTDKVFHANTMREILGLFLQVPQTAMQLAQQANVSELFADLLRTLGIKNINAYFQSPQMLAMQQQMAVQQQLMQQQGVQQPGVQAQPGQIDVQPDENVQRQVDAGNLVPTDMTRPAANAQYGNGSMGAAIGPPG